MTTELLSEYKEQLRFLPAKWYESELNRDWAFVLSTLTILFPYTFSLATSLAEKRIENQLVTTSFISLIVFTPSLIFDVYTTYRAFVLMDFLKTKDIKPPIIEQNPDLQHISSTEDYLKEFVGAKDVIALVASIIPVFGIPMAIQRNLAGLNNIRVVKRTQMAYQQKHSKLRE